MPRHTHAHLDSHIFDEPIFNEGMPSRDPDDFVVDHPSDNALYKQVEDLLKNDVVGFPASRLKDGETFSLASAYGARGEAVLAKIRDAGQIVFHAVGDTGASNRTGYGDQLRAADQLAIDARTGKLDDRASFHLHLGDVVYNFGEAAYYYDQFYEPYRDYPAPILAIPGNHDSFIVPGTASADEPLKTFMRNFCAERPVVTPEAGSLHRTAMTLPGIYFTVDAPFVRVITLFSNALEDPGVISSEGGRWPGVPDIQLGYLRAQLQRIRDEAYAGAVVLATHHPAFSYASQEAGTDGNHGSSLSMLRQIDGICADVGVYPHAFLSGHAHNYQRYTRTVHLSGAEYEVPFVVSGSGGHHVNRLVRGRRGQPAHEPLNGTDVSYMDVQPAIGTGGLMLEKYEDRHFGYLRVSADAERLHIGFHTVGASSLAQSRYDAVTLDLATHTLIAN